MAEEIKSVVMFDLDGCVSDDRWRFGMIPPDAKGNAAYAAYHDKCDQDPPLEKGALVLKSHIEAGHIILFTTGRPFKEGEKTANWIQKHFGITPTRDFSILMRQDNDERGAVDLKREFADFILKNAQSNRSPIVAAYDDRKDVVDMYRSLGLNACVLNADGLQVWEPTPPQTLAETHTGTEVFEEIREPSSAATILSEAAITYAERNAIYGDNAHKVGAVMKVLFPNGVTIRSEADHHLYHLFELIIVKLTRFTNSGLRHQDSIHDMAIYAAMVENLVIKKEHNIQTP